MNAIRFTDGFSEKILFPGKQAILGLKMVHLLNSGSTLRIFLLLLKFCIMKGTKGYMEIILMVFLKKYFGQIGHFGPKNGVTA